MSAAEMAKRLVKKFPQIEQHVIAPALTREATIMVGTLLDEIERRIAEAVAQAKAEEREACAKIAESEPELPGPMPDYCREAALQDLEGWSRAGVAGTKRKVAAAIRARGEKP